MSVAGGLALPRASLVLVGFAWVVPFLQPYHRYPLTGFYSEWLAFAFGLAAALLLLRRDSWRNAELPVIALSLLGFILLLALQVALGRVPYPEQALTAALYLSWAVLLLMLARALRRELPMATIAETLAWFALAGGILSALVGFIQHYQPYAALGFMVAQKGSGPVYAGNLGQPNHYAAYLSLALASAAYLHGRGRLHGALAGVCIALLTLMMALSGSRSPLLYLVALTLLAAFLYGRRPDAGTRRVALFALWLVPAFAVALWIAPLPLVQPAPAFQTSLDRLFESASGIQPRLQLAGEAWRMFLEAPLLGAGFGQFAWHHFAWSPPAGSAAAPGLYHHAHNLLLQLMAETGLAGSLLIVAAALYWFAGFRRAVPDLEWWWIATLLAVIGIHSLLEYPLWYSYLLAVASILLGLGAAQMLTIRMTRIGRAVTALALALGGINAVAIITPYRNFERLVFDARRDEPRRDDPRGSERAFGEAVMQIHREPLLSPYVELAISFGIVVSESDLRDKLDLNGRVMRFAPIDLVVYRQALLLAMNGEHEAARRQFELAARAYPRQLDEALFELRQLERRHPGRFAPLLELAAARSTELRVRNTAQ